MTDIMGYFKAILIVQLFFSFAITVLSYTIDDQSSLNYVASFSDLGNKISLDGTVDKVQNTITQQKNLPIVVLGGLVFYSGNILIDLLLNFAYALPEMVGLLLFGITTLFSFDLNLTYLIQTFLFVAITVWYVISLIQLLTTIRSGQNIA
jgi:hypothetical protein